MDLTQKTAVFCKAQKTFALYSMLHVFSENTCEKEEMPVLLQQVAAIRI